MSHACDDDVPPGNQADHMSEMSKANKRNHSPDSSGVSRDPVRGASSGCDRRRASGPTEVNVNVNASKTNSHPSNRGQIVWQQNNRWVWDEQVTVVVCKVSKE